MFILGAVVEVDGCMLSPKEVKRGWVAAFLTQRRSRRWMAMCPVQEVEGVGDGSTFS